MNKIKAVPLDRQATPQIDSTMFLDIEVKTDGKRLPATIEVTPELIRTIIKELPAQLDPQHLNILTKESAIFPATIAERGYRSASAVVLKRLGFPEKNGPGMLIPVRGIDGEIVSCQVRIDKPAMIERKKIKYFSPSGMDLRIDFPQRPLSPGEDVWITEGCKKADSLRSRGIYAVAVIGVSGWQKNTARKDLKAINWEGHQAIVCFDSDVVSKRGVKAAETALCAFLKELGSEEIQVTRIPSNPDGTKSGIDDFLADGGDLAKLAKTEADIGGSLVQDELGIAEALDSGENLLFTQTRFWGFSEAEGIWTEFPDEYVKRAIQKVCRNNRLAVKDSFVRGSFNCAKARFFRPVQFDQIDKRSIGASNGVLKYVGGAWKLSPYRREDYRRIRLPVAYDPTASCPRFDQFVEEIFEGTGDQDDRILAVLEFLGLSLTSNMEYEKSFILVGRGGNGKSVLFRTLEALVGVKNRSSVQMKQLENRFQRAHLDGKLVNLMEELSEGAEVPDAELKAIITGASITAEHKLRPPFEFDPICKLWISTNHMPGVRDLSDGIFRRFTILSFPVRFDNKPNRDTRLSEKLAAETSGILNYCLKALAGVYERGNLTDPASSKAALLAWEKDNDQTASFIEEEMVIEPGSSVASSTAYVHYTEWAKEAGIKRTLGRKAFTGRLEKHGAELGRGSGGVRLLFGMRCR